MNLESERQPGVDVRRAFIAAATGCAVLALFVVWLAALVLLCLRVAIERLECIRTPKLMAVATPLAVVLLLSADARAERMRPHGEIANHASAEVLRSIADAPVARLVVVNAPSRIAANPALVARAVGFRGQLTFAAVTSMCIDADSSPPAFRRTPTEVVIEFALPACAAAFWPRSVVTKTGESQDAQHLQRGTRWVYEGASEHADQSQRIVIRDGEPAQMYLWVDYRTGKVGKLSLIDIEHHQ